MNKETHELKVQTLDCSKCSDSVFLLLAVYDVTENRYGHFSHTWNMELKLFVWGRGLTDGAVPRPIIRLNCGSREACLDESNNDKSRVKKRMSSLV